MHLIGVFGESPIKKPNYKGLSKGTKVAFIRGQMSLKSPKPQKDFGKLKHSIFIL